MKVPREDVKTTAQISRPLSQKQWVEHYTNGRYTASMWGIPEIDIIHVGVNNKPLYHITVRSQGIIGGINGFFFCDAITTDTRKGYGQRLGKIMRNKNSREAREEL